MAIGMTPPCITRPVLRFAAAAAALLLAACANLVTWEPYEAAAPASAPIPAPRASEPLPARAVGPDDHLVRRGDTVYSIAFRNQLDYRDLAKWNRIGSDYLIYPGQVLRLTPPGALAPVGDEIASQGVDMDDTGAPRPISTTRTPVVMSAPAPVAPTPLPSPGLPALPPSPAVEPTVSTPVVATPSGGGGAPGWRWPVDGTVVRGYNPAGGAKGLDFTGTLGQPVVAAASGKVVYSGSALKGYGELVIIKHDDLRLSAYGYNRRRLVNEGDVVTAGQQIAELGLGPENKPLLHFEIRERGKPVNPVPFLPARVAGSP